MDVSGVGVHGHLLALAVRAEGGPLSRRASYGLAGAGIGELLVSGRVVHHPATGRVEKAVAARVSDPLLDALLQTWPPISGLIGRPTDLDTWVRRAAMVTGHRAAELAGAGLCAAGVLDRATEPGRITALVRHGVRYREADVAVVDELVAAARSGVAADGRMAPSLQLVLRGAETLGLLDPLGILPLDRLEGEPPWVDVVARAIRFAGVEFGFL